MFSSAELTTEDIELRILEFLIGHASEQFVLRSFSSLCNIVQCNDSSLVTHTLQLLADKRRITIGQTFNGIIRPYTPGRDDLMKSFLAHSTAYSSFQMSEKV